MTPSHATELMFRARVQMIGPEHGGRRTPFYSGYRPLLALHGWYTSAHLTLINQSECPPGGSAVVWLQPLWLELVRSRVSVGDQLELCEGARVVGVASILEVIDEAPATPVPSLEELNRMYPRA
jgi:translation elongation factor EF-Tu-like GTPase